MAKNGQLVDKLQAFKHVSVRRLIIAVVVLLIVLIGVILGELHSHESWGRIPVPFILTVAFAILGIGFALHQVCFPLAISTNETGTLTSPKLPPPTSGSSRSPKSLPGKPIYRNVNGIPSVNKKTTYERRKVVKDIYTSLVRQDMTALVLKGMAGVGKTTLAMAVARYAEEQRIAGSGPFTVEPIWLEINVGDTMNDVTAKLLKVFNVSLPHFKNLTSNEQVEALFSALNKPKMAKLVVIDQIDHLMDAQTGQISTKQASFHDWIDMLNRRQCASRVLFTSRFWSKMTFKSPSTYIREISVKGLENDEGVALLDQLGITGTIEEQSIAIECCKGHPFALRFLKAFLEDYCLSLNAFVKHPVFAKLWLEDVAQNILGDLFIKPLDQIQYTLLLAFSIYREAIPLDATESIIDFNVELTKKDIQLAFDILLAQSLISKVEKSIYELMGAAYQLHPLVASYIQGYYYQDEVQFTQPTLVLQSAHAGAAHYYLKKLAERYPSAEQRQDRNHIHLAVEAFWHLCQAGQYQEAYQFMDRDLFSDLEKQGENSTLLSLYQMLLPLENWHPDNVQEVAIYTRLGKVSSELWRIQEAKKYFEQALSSVGDLKNRGRILNELGCIYDLLGNKEKARKLFEQALYIAEEVRDHMEESKVLKELGLIYDELGQKAKARETLDRALDMSREVGDTMIEGRILNSLGLVYTDLGQKERAYTYFEQALKISREIGDRKGEVSTLRGLSQIYDEQGLKTEALTHLDQALVISREVRDRWEEGRILNYQGQLYTELRQYQQALPLYEQALLALKEVGDTWWESRVLNNVGHLYTELGRNMEAKRYLDQALHISQKVGDLRAEGRILNNSHILHDDLHKKREHLDRALNISREVGDRRGEGQAMHNLGHVLNQHGQKKEARDYYLKALHIHKEIGDHRRVGLTLHNIGLLYLEERHHEAALASLWLAKIILQELQSSDYEEVQKSIEILQEKMGKQRFDDLLASVEPKAQQMAKTGDYSPLLMN